MDREVKSALADKLLAMADDELILGHRDSEWCGRAPLLEEDIAFANLALDEIGHASLWYALLAELLGEDGQTYPDRMVYRRDASDFRSAQLVELPNGDWAFSMLRQYLFDSFESRHLQAISGSRYQPMADVAAKVAKEERYHLRHTSAWLRRLGLGTEESNRRLQDALDQLWPYTGQLFLHSGRPEILAAAGYSTSPVALFSGWSDQVTRHLQESGLRLPEPAHLPASPARDQHTATLKIMVADLQSVVRQEEEAVW
ncbi:MAG TPA: 1,2-phenylacetyl-CoA epoxidase subunit PaaC [Anaerolineales bacterium]|nr:1,2-phenylacetyl-CoA epoxidase subunit PaaC [Anaerolineales bacterium]